MFGSSIFRLVHRSSLAGAMVLLLAQPLPAAVVTGPVVIAVAPSGATLDLVFEGDGDLYLALDGVALDTLTLSGSGSVYIGDPLEPWPHLGSASVVLDDGETIVASGDAMLNATPDWDGGALNLAAAGSVYVGGFGDGVIGSLSINAGNLAIAPPPVLEGGGNVTLTGTVTVNGSDNITLNGGGTVNTGGISIGGNGGITLAGGIGPGGPGGSGGSGGSGGGTITLAGPIETTGGNFAGGTLTLDGNGVTLVQTPLPPAALLLAGGLLVLLKRGVRR